MKVVLPHEPSPAVRRLLASLEFDWTVNPRHAPSCSCLEDSRRKARLRMRAIRANRAGRSLGQEVTTGPGPTKEGG